jgi:hypothetical protein
MAGGAMFCAGDSTVGGSDSGGGPPAEGWAGVASNSLRAASMPKRGSLATCAGLRIVRTDSGVRTIVPPRSRRTLDRATAVWMASSSDMSHHSCGCCGAALWSIVRGSGVKAFSLGGVSSCGCSTVLAICL